MAEHESKCAIWDVGFDDIGHAAVRAVHPAQRLGGGRMIQIYLGLLFSAAVAV
jgi:hypothetical protein